LVGGPPARPATLPGAPVWDVMQAFKPRNKLVDKNSTMTVKLEQLAPLVLPTGHIVACDPFVRMNATAFERTVVPAAMPSRRASPRSNTRRAAIAASVA
jgi:hypothetical protein